MVTLLSLGKTRGSRKTGAKLVKVRLEDAFSVLTASPARAQRPTVSTLCRMAAVSRNTVYRYYPEVAQRMQQLRRRRVSSGSAHKSVERALRSEVAALRGQVAKLASLADHYYAAAEEQRALVARRDRELAAQKERLRPARIPR